MVRDIHYERYVLGDELQYAALEALYHLIPFPRCRGPPLSLEDDFHFDDKEEIHHEYAERWK